MQLVLWAVLAVLLSAAPERTLIMAAVEAVTAVLACLYARRQLGGMSGDIAGYTICISELAGILVLAIW